MRGEFTILDAAPRYLIRVVTEVEVCPAGTDTPLDRLVEGVRLAVEQGAERHLAARSGGYSRVYAPNVDQPGTWATERGVVWSPPAIRAELVGWNRNPDTCLPCATERECEAHS